MARSTLKTIQKWLPKWAKAAQAIHEPWVTPLLGLEVDSKAQAIDLVSLRLKNTAGWLNGVRPRTPPDWMMAAWEDDVVPQSIRSWFRDDLMVRTSSPTMHISAGVVELLDIEVSSRQEALDHFNAHFDAMLQKVQKMQELLNNEGST